MNVESEWPPALLQEAQAREREGSVTALRGGAHDDGQTSHPLSPPSCLRESDIRALENARNGSPTKLGDHLEFLRRTIPWLRGSKPNQAEQLEELRLPYLEQVLPSRCSVLLCVLPLWHLLEWDKVLCRSIR